MTTGAHYAGWSPPAPRPPSGQLSPLWPTSGAVMEGGKGDGETRVTEVTARRRFMITDILSSVGRQDVGKEERAAPAGLDMRLLFPGLTGGQEDAEEGEEGEEDGEEGDRGEGARRGHRKVSKNLRLAAGRLEQLQNGRLTKTEN